MNSNNYIRERLVDQINWYEKKSALNKKQHLLGRSITMILAACIPVLAIFIQTGADKFSFNVYLQVGFGVIGFLLIVINGWGLVNNHQDQWNHYRRVAEALKHEKNLFKNRSGAYKNADSPEQLLVERVETIISPRHST